MTSAEVTPLGFGPDSRFFRREGKPVLRWLERGEGEPVLFLHGLTGSAEHDWRPQTDDLARDHRTIALDLRGHGASELDDTGLSSRVVADDVAAFLDAVAEGPVHACGFSFGAGVLLTLADRQPHHFLSLTLVGVSHRYDPGNHRRFLESRHRWPASLRRLHRAGPRHWERLLELGEQDWLSLCLDPAPWKGWSFPVLLIVGERDDPSKLEQSGELAAAIAASRRMIVPQAGHMVQLEQPSVVTAAIRAHIQDSKSVERPAALAGEPAPDNGGIT